ncbi:MAG: hypothetical protein CVU40_17145 [Chloroflexi bacterium HGW-Chloroflexi-2]|jgi:branched-chain amino acid transport system ATP-binding protein|nr:MAG: hypothetical protein CVU40_17145 [Chloroflexi bacterium HGW-Chloroflexi-2]
MNKLLEVKNVVKKFGGLTAINNFSLEVYKNEMIGLIGPNGAGKTTCLNIITAFLKPNSGKILFEEKDITNLSSNKKACKGIVRTFQANNVFKDMTVRENILIGLNNSEGVGFWTPIYTFFGKNQTATLDYKVDQIIKTMSLDEYRNIRAGSLPHGFQRLLGIAVALTTRPKLLLLDEPFTGMITEESELLVSIIKKLRKEREISIIMVEHNMKAVMELCDRIVVLNFGSKIAEGIPIEIQNNKDVIDAYLGIDEGEKV